MVVIECVVSVWAELLVACGAAAALEEGALVALD